MEPITLGLAGAGLAANLIGQISSANKQKQASRLLNSQIADLTGWKNLEANRNYLDSNAGRNVINKASEKFRQQAQTAKSAEAITGASDEAALAQSAAAGENLGSVISDVAAQGAVREDQIQNQYRTNMANLIQQKIGLLQGQSQSGSNLASSAGSFISGLAPLATKLPVTTGITATTAAPMTQFANKNYWSNLWGATTPAAA